MKKIMFVLSILFSVLMVTTAFADLIFDMTIDVTGTGLGNVNTVVTVLDSTTPNGTPVTESGGINQDGSFSPVTQFGIEGGDNQAINNVISLANNLNFAAVVNVAETGQDLTATLTDLYLTFKGSNGTYTAFYNGPDLVLGTTGGNAGTGGSGWAFRLDDAQFAIVSALGSDVTISGGVQFANGTTNDGLETVYVTQIEGGGGPPSEVQVPEPMSLILLGSGLAGVGLYRRLRKPKG